MSSSSKFEVVITDSDFPDTQMEQDALGKIGATVRKLQTYREEDVIREAKDADVILADYAPINRNVIGNLRKARAVVEYGVGYDNIDVKAATEKGILVCHIPDFMTSEVAEHSLALILALHRRITWADSFVKSGGWSKYGPLSWEKLMPLTNMEGKVAGIVGFGRIGRQVAERLKAFGVSVMAYDPYVNAETASKLGVRLVDLSTLFREADIVSVNALLSKETFHLIGESQIRSMKKSAMLVNTSRGKIIDQVHLLEALRSKSIAAAGLDVLETEPPSDSAFLELDNVVLTPHIAGTSEKSVHNLRVLAVEEARRALTGEAPRHPVNPEVLAKKA